MARTESQQGNFIYHVITADGYFAERSKEAKDGFYAYTKKNNEVEYRRNYDMLEGELHSIKIKKFKVNGADVPHVVVTIKDGDCFYIFMTTLAMQSGSLTSYTRSLCVYAKNIDPNKKFGIKCSKDKAKGKNYVEGKFFIKQDDTFIKAFYTKDNSPKWTKTTHPVTKEDSWDTTEQDTLLMTALEELMAKLDAKKESSTPSSPQPAQSTPPTQDHSNGPGTHDENPNGVDDADDLPF